jgi:prevent-host-death family protein
MGRPAEQIGLRELRQNASDVVRRAENGTDFEVTVNGRAAVRLSSVQPKVWRGPADLAVIYAGPHWGDAASRDELDQAIDDPWEHGA